MQAYSDNLSKKSMGWTNLGAPLSLAVFFILELFYSWRKWPDLLVDFGRELYLPWRISQGEVLYKDITHSYGPLSQYFHALLFKLFGISYLTIIVSNIVLFVLFLILLYFLILKTLEAPYR